MKLPPSLSAHLSLVAVLAVGTFALANFTEIEHTGLAGVTLQLPDQVERWHGDEIFYCLTPHPQEVFLRSEALPGNRCPECGEVLSQGSRSEWALLPSDTRIHKKLYRRPGHSPVVGSIVLSGSSRTSIHRPQICLVGPGREIVRTRTLPIEITGRPTLRVTVLDMLNQVRNPDGTWREFGTYYAYWFVSPRHETHSHWVRMFWMAYDQIFRGQTHRWAYISVSGNRDLTSDAHLGEIQHFTANMFPLLAVESVRIPE
ncbi:MAG TPA: exosortase-associated EpsI family protein [Kiritimatiellia bacterium]|nr:exosortase-associated EpsI family protein [Kiritimatiellia bacterium]